MASPAVVLSLLLDATRGQTEKYIKTCPENRRLKNLGPGKATPLWLVGHLANTTDFLGNVIGLGRKSTIPAEWRPKFSPSQFGGDAITTNAGDYPSWDEVAAMYTNIMSQYSEGIKGLSDADLAGAPKGKLPDALKTLTPTIQAGASLHIVHDSHHRGQLALIANLGD